MDESFHFVECEQGGLCLRWAREVHGERHVRAFADAVDDSLRAEFCHPCAGAFRGAREEIGVKYADEIAFIIGDIKRFYFRIIY